MKTRFPTDNAIDSEDASRAAPVVISALSVTQYTQCKRAWWLADFLEYHPDEELVLARQALDRRRQLVRGLNIAGGAMIGLSVVIFVVALLIAG